MSEDKKEEYKIMLSGEGISVEKILDRRTAFAVVATIMGEPQDTPIAAHGATTKNTAPPKSLREFLNEVDAKTSVEKIAAMGYFMCENLGQNSFTKDEVKAKFAVAKEAMPANFSRDFGKALKSGLINEVHGEKGNFYVTSTGMKEIEKNITNQ